MKGYFSIFLFLLFSMSSFAEEGVSPKVGEPFDHYLARIDAYLDSEKVWVNAGNKASEKQAVMPYEIKASDACSSKTGLLFIHGLSDSPYSLKSMSHALKKECIWVRGILLDGHGTKQEDLLHVTRGDWRNTVKVSADEFSKKVDELYLVGFSTGGGLALDYGVKTNIDNLQGIILVSPLIKINNSVDWLLVFLSPFIDWLDQNVEDDYAKYASIPVPTMKEAYKLSIEVRKHLNRQAIQLPVFIVASEQDATLDTSVTLDYLRKIPNPLSRFVLYSSNPEQEHLIAIDDPRLSLKKSYWEELRISSLSHIGVHIAPEDAHYGQYGDYRVCDWYLGKAEFMPCKKDQMNWFGEKGELLKSKSEHGARVTWNPDFEALIKDIAHFVENTSKSKR